MKPIAILALVLAGLATPAGAEATAANTPVMQARDVFNLEYAADPQISPDGRRIAYVRKSFDIMTDRARSNIWLLDVKSGEHRPILSGTASYSSPRWSPDGKRIAYVSGIDSGSQIYVRWMDTGATARVTDLQESPAGLAWSPHGGSLAFTMFVKNEGDTFAEMPTPPEGAKWAPKPKVIDQINYRGDGEGYYEQGYTHVFVVPADGGTPRQLTSGDFDHDGTPAWSRDGRTLFVSANREAEAERTPYRAQIFAVDATSGTMTQLTRHEGPSFSPKVSPDGRRIAWLGFDDDYRGEQLARLHVMDADGGNTRTIANDFGHSIDSIDWRDNSSLFVQYDDDGVTRLGVAGMDGHVREVASNLGGESLGRPYSAASFSVSDGGTAAFNVTSPTEPADLAVLSGGNVHRLTRLNADVAQVRHFQDAEQMWTTAADGTRSEFWIIKPPSFDPARKYPMILEIHGGPFANYGPRFSAEMQLYAAAGYVVLYGNPRGSTSYGADYANMIDKAYPGGDYDDLMAAVDGLLAKGYVDPDRQYVTGGSGGGVLTAWIVGKTDRFRAAVVAKPVINWTSFVLTSDGIPYFHKYWFGTNPWEDQAHYWARSPLSLVGNVKTPTMLLAGESDYRTPVSESEQFYGALQIRGVDTAMVRIPEASHEIATRPSNMIAKVNYILAWFAKHRDGARTAPPVAAR